MILSALANLNYVVTSQELHVIDGIPQLIFVRANYTIEVRLLYSFTSVGKLSYTVKMNVSLLVLVLIKDCRGRENFS